MLGTICTKDVLRHPVLIAHEFGWRVLARALRLAVSPGVHTFLEAIR